MTTPLTISQAILSLQSHSHSTSDNRPSTSIRHPPAHHRHHVPNHRHRRPRPQNAAFVPHSPLHIPIKLTFPASAITGTWTLPFAAYFLLLTNRIVYHRLTTKTYIGDRLSPPSPSPSSPSTSLPPSPTSSDQLDPLYLATRAQSNFLETVPLAFIFALVAELNGANRKVLNWVLAALLVFRVGHVEVGLRGRGALGWGRPVGYYGSQAVVLGLGGWAGGLVRGYWGF